MGERELLGFKNLHHMQLGKSEAGIMVVEQLVRSAMKTRSEHSHGIFGSKINLTIGRDMLRYVDPVPKGVHVHGKKVAEGFSSTISGMGSWGTGKEATYII